MHEWYSRVRRSARHSDDWATVAALDMAGIIPRSRWYSLKGLEDCRGGQTVTGTHHCPLCHETAALVGDECHETLKRTRGTSYISCIYKYMSGIYIVFIMYILM